MKNGSIQEVLRVAAFEPRSLVNGPGVRAVLWVQGCGRRCPGCFNPDFLPRAGGRVVPVAEVAGWMAAERGAIEGVTFSGGEPFDQAGPLAALAEQVRVWGLGVMIFTGHPWSDLMVGQEPGWRALMAAADLLVAGPYEREQPGAHPLLASENQQLVHLTDRYRAALEAGRTRRVELRIGGSGVVRVTGFPGRELRDEMKAKWNRPSGESTVLKGADSCH